MRSCAGRTKLGIARAVESGFKRIVRRCRRRTHVVDFVGIGRAAQVVDRVLRQHHAEVDAVVRSPRSPPFRGAAPSLGVGSQVDRSTSRSSSRRPCLSFRCSRSRRRLARVLSDGDVERAVFGQPAARADPHFRLHRLEIGQLEHAWGARPIDAPGRRAVEPDDLVPRPGESSARIFPANRSAACTALTDPDTGPRLRSSTPCGKAASAGEPIAWRIRARIVAVSVSFGRGRARRLHQHRSDCDKDQTEGRERRGRRQRISEHHGEIPFVSRREPEQS